MYIFLRARREFPVTADPQLLTSFRVPRALYPNPKPHGANQSNDESNASHWIEETTAIPMRQMRKSFHSSGAFAETRKDTCVELVQLMSPANSSYLDTQEKPFTCNTCGQRFSRSDLLVRHDRLNHGNRRKQSRGRQTPSSEHGPQDTSQADSPARNKRQRIDEQPAQILPNGTFTTSANANNDTIYSDVPFATLLMAAEQSQFRDAMPPPPPPATNIPPTAVPDWDMSGHSGTGEVNMAPDSHVSRILGFDIDDSLQDIAAFMDGGPLLADHFSSFLTSEQPLPFFSPSSSHHQPTEVLPSVEPHNATSVLPDQHEDVGSFSRFGSRLPSLQPHEDLEDGQENGPKEIPRKDFADVSREDRRILQMKLLDFASVIPDSFQPPSPLALSRYLAAYVSGFHEHLPFLHIATMSINTCSPELILAIAAVGAQYCFEVEKTVELFHISQNIANHRIRSRDVGFAVRSKQAETLADTQSQITRESIASTAGETPRSSSISGPLGVTSRTDYLPSHLLQKEDLVQTAQSLLLLMALATWAKHREVLREALSIQSILATLIRDDGLERQYPPDNADWLTWAQYESTKRTKWVVFSFFNLHCVVYNIPPLILNSEIDLLLPCNGSEFRASTAVKWKDASARSSKAEVGFQEAFKSLFSTNRSSTPISYSSMGNYILVNALIQHIFFVRQVSRYRLIQSGDLSNEELESVEHALRKWQAVWKRNPESSLDPSNPAGPLTFNSTALLRLAYIRLSVDLGPGRALDTRDPEQIARAFRRSPAIKRSQKLLRAVLHAAHALSIPIKIGINIVAQTQTFRWSIQHSLATLECAFLLSKWLEALGSDSSDVASVDELKIASLVKTMLDETEFSMPTTLTVDSRAAMRYLSASVLRVWAKVFRGAQTWAIVDIIGTSLNVYADLLEAT